MKLRSLLFATLLAVAGAQKFKMQLMPLRLAGDVKYREVNNHLTTLSSLGKNSKSKNRAFGHQGYERSLDFVLNRVKRFKGSSRITVQEFYTPFDATYNITLIGPDGTPIRVRTVEYNVGTPLPDGITATLVGTPVDDKRGSACFEDQWRGINATGKIVLIKRGMCALAQKVRLAKRHGARAVLVYNTIHGRVPADSLGFKSVNQTLPVGQIRLWDGKAMRERLAAGEKLTVTLMVDAVVAQRKATNVIVDTKAGSPDSVIMLGAKYDSAKGGPGINDNASGVSALLEVLERIHPYVGFNNTVRFAFWGADERDLAGSRYYVSNLTEADLDKIRFYMDFNMLSSRNPVWTVFANNEADEFAGDYLMEFLHRQKKNATYSKFGSTSGYVPFIEHGIPSSGITTYAGEFGGALADVCRGRWCDDKLNVRSSNVYKAAKAIAYAAARLALSVEGLPLRNKTLSVEGPSKK